MVVWVRTFGYDLKGMVENMRFDDLLSMSVNNLKGRRLRTLLTVLGVVIGTGSIVVMISLGLGLQKQSRKLVEASGGLTTIQVMERFG